MHQPSSRLSISFIRSGTARPAGLIAGALAFLGAAMPASAAGDGYGWDALEAALDDRIIEWMDKENIPGLTVAASKDGKLVLYKGYGVALAGENPKPMNHAMRTRIGSNSKVLVTGPSAFRMMQQKNINRTTKKVYGDGGVFGSTFNPDINIGAKRYYPIQAMAIGPGDKVYTWYVNGTVSVGASFDLDRHAAPQSFDLPSNRNVADIRDIAITDDGRVYTWYNNGRISVGTHTDLGATLPVMKKGDGEDAIASIPGRRSMLNVVGIALAKSNNRVYVWYDDGTVSSGSPVNFGAHFSNRQYLPASDPLRYNIRAMGIASNDHVYTWDSGGKVRSGRSNALSHYSAPRTYTYPAIPNSSDFNPVAWYREMTLAHLLTHRSGLQHSGDTTGTERMFGVTLEQMTYEQSHQHFLRTRPLRWAPGTEYAYSNHGFGLWTAIFPRLTGQTYKNYAINQWLKPLGVYGAFREMTKNNDYKDAYPHYIQKGTDNVYRTYPFKDQELGLAAGGWTSSAGAVLMVTKYLAENYSRQELIAMGWGFDLGNSVQWGQFSHNGRTGGGTSYITMLEPGYTSAVTGDDIGNIHVVVNANISADTDAMKRIADMVVRAIPKANVSSSYDIWNR